MNRIATLEIQTCHFARARRFYENVFERQIPDDAATAETSAVGTLSGGQLARGGVVTLRRLDEAECASRECVCAVMVDSLDDTIARIIAAGGRIVVPLLDLTEAGVVAHAADPEGNRFDIVQQWAQWTR